MIILVVFLVLISGSYFALQNSWVQTYLTQKIALQISKRTNSKISIGRVNIAFFKKVVLEDFLMEDQLNDTLFYTELITAKIDTFKYRKKKLSINQLTFKKSNFTIEQDSAAHFNFTFLFKTFSTTPDTLQSWQIDCSKFELNESKISFNDIYKNKVTNLFVHDLNFEATDFTNKNDTLLFNINKMSANDGKRLFLNNLSSEILIIKNKIEVKNLELLSKSSALQNTQLFLNFPEKNTNVSDVLEIDLQIGNSKINLSELSELLPAFKGMNENLSLSGRIYGDINDLKGKDLVLKTGKNTSAIFDFYINDLTDIKNMYLFLDLKQSETNFTDLSKIKLPNSSSLQYLKFPKSFYESGNIKYKGNFTGFLTDFVAFGTFASEVGILTTDVSVVPDKAGNVKYRGKVATTDFELGKLFQNKLLGKLTFKGNVDANYDKTDGSINGIFLGYIDEIVANNYSYKNILFDGLLDNKMFDGLLSMDDPNLKFNFSGQINLNPEIPDFDFNLDLKKALPGNLNLSKNFPASEVAFKMNANFKGNKLDNLLGNIVLEDGLYKNRNGELNLKGLELKSELTDTIDKLFFNSDYFDIEIIGQYHFQNLLADLKKTAQHFLPSLYIESEVNNKFNNFEFQLNVKSLDELSKVFTPEYKVETPFLLYGKLDSENKNLELNGSIPGFTSKNLWVKNIFLGNKPLNNYYSSKVRIGELLYRNDLALYNLSFDTKLANDTVNNQITWTNFHNLTYSGTLKTQTVLTNEDSSKHPTITIEGLPSTIYIADSLWQIAPYTAVIDSSALLVNNFSFYKQDQSISVNGKIAEDSSNVLNFQFENIDLEQLGKYLKKETYVSGKINGTTGIMDFYNQRIISSDLNIDNFKFQDQQIGDISIKNNWDNFESVINSELLIKNKDRISLLAEGFFKPSTKTIEYNAELDHLSLVVFETLIRKNFSNFHGDGTGKVKISGTPEAIMFNGAIEGSNAGLTIDYTQVSYHFNDSVYFKGDTIHFDNITINDVNKNKGVFDGTIVHQNFKNMQYDLSVRSPKIMALNTTPKNNELFFGKVIASGNLDITGVGTKVNLTGTGTTLSGTNVNISLEYENEIEQYDFIQFVTTEQTEKEVFLFPNKKTDDFSLNLTVHATPEARAQLIYNSQIGDVIKAQGEGILKFGMDKEGNITLAGNYTVDKGDYLFTLQNVINKRFSIERGGSLVWSGDPYNAIIDLNAVYKLKASLYDLLVNSFENVYQNQRIPVECKIKLIENLSNPAISFEIDFPTVEDRIIDELQQYFNTEEEINKQILSLLVLGKFYTPEYMRGTYEAQNPNLIGTTASELFSNQLSNWLSQINNNVDIGLNYRPGNQITDDEVELALSTQMFNDRVTLNGNIGNNVNPYSSNNSQIVGDFEVNVKLTPNGKVQFKAYNRSNNNLIYETAPYTQGIGLSFKEEYNSINELFRKLGLLFKSKNK